MTLTVTLWEMPYLNFSVNASKNSSDKVIFLGVLVERNFLFVFKNTSLEGARILAEKIRECIERETGSSQNLPAITVSIGISSLKEDDKEVFDIIKRSDQALYAAKKNGRNQVQIL